MNNSRTAEPSRYNPGSTPGIESINDVDQPPKPSSIRMRCIDYGPERCESREIDDLESFLAEPLPEGCNVRWFNIDGLHPYVVNKVRLAFNVHTLAAEDVLCLPQRPKLEEYDDHLFIVMRMLMFRQQRLSDEQFSVFFFRNTVITFQETEGDVWEPIRHRISKPTSRLRAHGASYLLYALFDAVVDHWFPILENYGELIERLEDDILEQAVPAVQRRIHRVKRELAQLRRVVWPTRDVINALQRPEIEDISEVAKTYMRDVYDHCVQVIDVVESYREMAGGLNDLYNSVVSNRMNEIMKMLTIMASFFIPVTFVAGVYGMNFEHIPELHWKYSYAVFWGICMSMVIGLLIFFHRRGWLGESRHDEDGRE